MFFDKLAKDIGSNMKGLMDSAVSAVQSIDVSELQKAGENAVSGIQKAIQGTVSKENNPLQDKPAIASVPAKNALMILFCLIASDGVISDDELNQFDEIGNVLCDNFEELKAKIMNEYQEITGKMDNPEDFQDLLHEKIEKELTGSADSKERAVLPKQLIWNLLVTAYADQNYSSEEGRIIRHVIRTLNIDQGVIDEMENSLHAFEAIEEESEWLLNSNICLLDKQEMIEELEKRKQVILDSVKTLIEWEEKE